MIPQVGRTTRRRFLAVLAAGVMLAGCGRRPLPFPTPAQHDLIVLVQEGPLTYALDDGGKPAGLEYDLIEAFAQELGVGVRYLVASANDILRRLNAGEAHFAATWHSPGAGLSGPLVPPFLHTVDVVAQHDASLPVDETDDLRGRTVHVMAGSRQAAALRDLRAKVPGLHVVERGEGSVFDLLEAVGGRDIDLAVVDSAYLEIAQQFVPAVQATLALGEARPVAWLFGVQANQELLNRASAFIAKAGKDGTLDRLRDRYLGHVRRLRPADVGKLIEMMETALPKLRKHFQEAQALTGIDWRLIAAIAYQESQWDATATSPTGVRGIMMLTEETADRLGVANRLDARESILAGARYFDMIKQMLPSSVPEPDRTWMALAGYNLGPGHLSAGRTLARQLKADPDSWYELKRVLPLLAQPKYYQKLKSGRARGGEAVILAENIRSYYDILSRFQPPFRPLRELMAKADRKHDKAAGKATRVAAADGPGLRPK